MLRIILILVIILAVFTAFSALIPDQFTSSMDTALISLLGYIGALNVFVNASTIYTCLEILTLYFSGMVIAVLLMIGLRITAGNK